MPTLTLPLPEATAWINLTTHLVGDRGPSTLLEANTRLSVALWSSGYVTLSHWLAPDGFAILTELEQIEESGRPKVGEQRWSTSASPITWDTFSIRNYLRALLTANSGYYRVLLFIVSGSPIIQSEEPTSWGEMVQFIHGGSLTPSMDLSLKKWTDQMQCVALIYEFRRDNGEDATFLTSGTAQADLHVQDILLALDRPDH